MDFGFILKSKRFWTGILTPVLAWGFTKFPAVTSAAIEACTIVTGTPDAEGVVHQCSPGESQIFFIGALTALATWFVGMTMGNRKLSLLPVKKLHPEPNSGDQGGMPGSPNV
jgi:hypothetical protein